MSALVYDDHISSLLINSRILERRGAVIFRDPFQRTSKSRLDILGKSLHQ